MRKGQLLVKTRPLPRRATVKGHLIYGKFDTWRVRTQSDCSQGWRPLPSAYLLPMSASCGAYTAYSNQTNAVGWSNALYELTRGSIFDKRIIAAFQSGNYNHPNVDKCCSICSTGSYDGVSYSFHEDSAGTIAASCASFTIQFVDDPSTGGYYCHFFKTAQAAAFDGDCLMIGCTNSTFYAPPSAAEACDSSRSFPDASLQEPDNADFQRLSWRFGCVRADEVANATADATACTTACAGWGCCEPPAYADPLPQHAAFYSECHSSACSGDGCCEASDNICMAACHRYFGVNPPPSLPPAPPSPPPTLPPPSHPPMQPCYDMGLYDYSRYASLCQTPPTSQHVVTSPPAAQVQSGPLQRNWIFSRAGEQRHARRHHGHRRHHGAR